MRGQTAMGSENERRAVTVDGVPYRPNDNIPPNSWKFEPFSRVRYKLSTF